MQVGGAADPDFYYFLVGGEGGVEYDLLPDFDREIGEECEGGDRFWSWGWGWSS